MQSVFQLPDSHRVLIAVSHDRYRPPTGISRFPNGGVPQYLDKKVVVYAGEVSVPRLRTLDTLSVSRSVWQGLSVGFYRWDGRHAYLQLHGCPAQANGCFDSHGDSVSTLSRNIWFRVRPGARPERIDSVPRSSGLSNGSVAQEPDEQHYPRVRLVSSGVEVQSEPDGSYRLVYRLQENGSLGVVEGSVHDTAGR